MMTPGPAYLNLTVLVVLYRTREKTTGPRELRMLSISSDEFVVPLKAWNQPPWHFSLTGAEAVAVGGVQVNNDEWMNYTWILLFPAFEKSMVKFLKYSFIWLGYVISIVLYSRKVK